MVVSTSCCDFGETQKGSGNGNGSTCTQMALVCNKRNFRKRQNGVPKIFTLMMREWQRGLKQKPEVVAYLVPGLGIAMLGT